MKHLPGVSGRMIYIGTFEQKDDAIKARKKAEQKYGFHPNHGKSPAIRSLGQD